MVTASFISSNKKTLDAIIPHIYKQREAKKCGQNCTLCRQRSKILLGAPRINLADENEIVVLT